MARPGGRNPGRPRRGAGGPRGTGKKPKEPAASRIPLPGETASALGLTEACEWRPGWFQRTRLPPDNPGLLFNRYFPRIKSEKGREGEKESGKHQLLIGLADAVNKVTGPREMLAKLARRQEAMARALAREKGTGVLRIEARQAYRLVAQTALTHPLENGFCFHALYGVPCLPGSSLKGAVRAALLRTLAAEAGCDDLDEKKSIVPLLRRSPDGMMPLRELFGSAIKDRRVLKKAELKELDPMRRGRLVFLDAFPSECRVVADVLTPHYGKYYRGEKPAPSDTEDPVPTFFLALETGTSWTFHVILEPPRAPGTETAGDPALRGAVVQAVRDALETWGLGAKRAAGYGWFKDVQCRWLPETGTAGATTAKASEASGPPPEEEHPILRMATRESRARPGDLGLAKQHVTRAWQEGGPELAQRVAEVWKSAMAGNKKSVKKLSRHLADLTAGEEEETE